MTFWNISAADLLSSLVTLTTGIIALYAAKKTIKKMDKQIKQTQESELKKDNETHRQNFLRYFKDQLRIESVNVTTYNYFFIKGSEEINTENIYKFKKHLDEALMFLPKKKENTNFEKIEEIAFLYNIQEMLKIFNHSKYLKTVEEHEPTGANVPVTGQITAYNTPTNEAIEELKDSYKFYINLLKYLEFPDDNLMFDYHTLIQRIKMLKKVKNIL